MGRTCRIMLDEIGKFARSGYYIAAVGFLTMLFHVFAWDLAGLLLFLGLTSLALLFVDEYRAWLTLFANAVFIVSTQNSPGYGDGSNYYTTPGVLIPLVIAVVVTVLCMVYRTIKERKNLKSCKLMLPLIVLCAAMFLSGVGKPYYGDGLIAVVLMAVSFLGVYVVFSATVKSDDGLFDYICTLLTEIAFVVALEIAFVYVLNIAQDGSFDGDWKSKIVTGWGVSNVSGELVAFLLPFAFMKAERSKHAEAFGLIALFSATMIVFTLSRTGMLIGFPVTVVFMVNTMFNRKSERKRLVLTFVGYLSFLLVIFIALIGYTEFNDVFKYFETAFFRGGHIADSGRFRIWKLRWEYFLSSPINGVGFAKEFCEGANRGGLIFAGFAHNFVMEVISSSGIIGVLATGYFIYALIKAFIVKSEARFFTVAFLIAYAAVGLLDITYGIPYCIWFLMLVTVTVEKINSRPKGVEGGKN